MTTKRFRPKIDRWLLFLPAAVPAVQVVVRGIAATRVNEPGKPCSRL